MANRRKMSLPAFRPDIGTISYNTDIVFQALDWFAEDNDTIDIDIEDKNAPKKKFVVTIFGVTKQGNTVSVDVTGYSPQFYIQIPEHWDKADAAKYVRGLKETFAAEMAQRLGPKTRFNPMGDALKGFKLVERKRLMGFDADRYYPFLQLSFYNISGMRGWVRKIQERRNAGKDEDELVLFESNIDPLLRFIHIQKMKPLGWMKVMSGKFDLPDDHDRLSQAYVVVDQSALAPIDDESVAPFLIASFDIEADSSTGDFPMAKRGSKIRKVMLDIVAAAKSFGKSKGTKTDEMSYHIKSILDSRMERDNSSRIFRKLQTEGIIDGLRSIYENNPDNTSGLFLKDDEEVAPKRPKADGKETEEALFELLNKNSPEIQGDRVIQIGTTFQRYGDPSYSFKHVVTLDTCDPIDGVFVHACKTETELLLAWRDLITRADPDIITGKLLP